MEAKTEFDKLMRDAVAIKSAQLSQYRRKFDKWPQFHQAGLYYSDSFASIRSLPFSEKIPVYESKKQEGTVFFNSEDYQQALHKYEETLTLFRWVKNRNEKWRNSGIEDDDLTIENIEKSPQIVEMMVSLYLNIALCNIKLVNWKEAVMACDEALELDPENVKAMYRKSLALTLPAGSDLDDFRSAIRILTKALGIDPQNSQVRSKLHEFKIFLKEQKSKSKETFHSFFKKPAYEDAEPEDTSAKNNAEYDELISKGECTVKDLRSNGKTMEARKLEKNIKLMKNYKEKAVNDAKKKMIDFDNPSEEMKKNAKEFGLDLEDPIVKAELNRMKEKQLQKQKIGKKGEKPEKIQKKNQTVRALPQKNYSYIWWILGIFIIFIGAYMYVPTEHELW